MSCSGCLTNNNKNHFDVYVGGDVEGYKEAHLTFCSVDCLVSEVPDFARYHVPSCEGCSKTVFLRDTSGLSNTDKSLYEPFIKACNRTDFGSSNLDAFYGKVFYGSIACSEKCYVENANGHYCTSCKQLCSVDDPFAKGVYDDDEKPYCENCAKDFVTCHHCLESYHPSTVKKLPNRSEELYCCSKPACITDVVKCVSCKQAFSAYMLNKVQVKAKNGNGKTTAHVCESCYTDTQVNTAQNFETLMKQKAARCIYPEKTSPHYQRALKVSARFNTLNKELLQQYGFTPYLPYSVYKYNLDAESTLFVGPLFAYISKVSQDGTATPMKVYDILSGDTLTYANSLLDKLPMLTPFCAAMSLRTSLENYV